MINFKQYFLIVFLFATVNAASTRSFIVSSEETKEGIGQLLLKTSNVPQINEMLIQTRVTNRYAKTLITSKVKNLDLQAREAVFFVVLPDKAFISEFVMEIGGKSYKAYVKEKEEAKNIYNQAVSTGQSAAHVEVNARDSNKISVSLNIEPQGKAVFKLSYEELLERQKGKYEVILNIHPGQIVPKLEAEVVIAETLPLSFVRTPYLRSGNEIFKSNDDLKPNAEVININGTSSIVKFHPSIDEQIKFATALSDKESDGLSGQFIVEYDVNRKNTGGEVLLKDGYFVHFFAPEQLEILPTQVMFVLDISGSMGGIKIQQLIDAMVNILCNLGEHDSFSIVTFSTSVQVWNINSNNLIDLRLGETSNYGNLWNVLKGKEIPEPVKATAENIEAAKTFVKTLTSNSLTNIIGGLEVGLYILKNAPKNSDFQQPLLIFLTDGLPNIGISNGDAIINTVAKLNPVEEQIPIYSLSFGSGADKNFLRKLSSKNLGFSRHIYEAADASLQLQVFYQLISSPMLKNVEFKYTKSASSTTKNEFPIFFRGSEIVVAGRIPMDSTNEYTVEGWKPSGKIQMKPKIIESEESLERLWAFLQVRQLLDEREVTDEKTDLSNKAVDLALKYSFVTPVTSLIVVKPNEISAVNTEDVATKSNVAKYSTPLLHRTGGSPHAFSPPIHQQTYLRTDSSYNSYNNRIFFGDVQFPYQPPVQTTTTAPSFILATSTISTPQLKNVPVPLPELLAQTWFTDIMLNSSTIQVKNTNYKLATYDTRVRQETCFKKPHKMGHCKLIHECENTIPSLTNFQKFADVFCSLKGYAGVCCDMHSVIFM